MSPIAFPIRDDAVHMIVIVVTVILASGCTNGGTRESSVVRDSAGIRVVENVAPLWTDETAWRLSPEPTIEIGGSEDDPEQQFLEIVGLARLSDGRIVVADGTSAELRFFAENGRHLRTVGGKGGGPGEFRNIGNLVVLPGDTLIATNIPPSGRLAWFDGEGEFLTQSMLDLPSVPPTHSSEFSRPLADGSLLIWVYERVTGPIEGAHRSRYGFWRVATAEAPPDTLGWFDDQEIHYLEGGRGVAGPTPHTSQTLFTWTDEHFFVAESGRYEIRRMRYDGTLDMAIRRDVPSSPVTADDRDAFREQILEFARQSNREPAYQRWLDQITFPDTKPAFDALVADRTGHLWVRNPGQPSDPVRTWTVYDPTGLMLGDIPMPADLCEPFCSGEVWTVIEIGHDYVLAVARDELDVEHVRLYELIKP